MTRQMGSILRIFAPAGMGLAAVLGTWPALGEQLNFDNGAGTGVWNDPVNWRGAGADLAWGTPDDTNVLPGLADTAVIHDGLTAALTSASAVGDVVVGWPLGAGAPGAPGVATLNIGPGAVLETGVAGNTSGIRVGRAAAAVGTSQGVINQTGGSVSMLVGTNGLRLSQSDGTTVADSLYIISGGSLRGGGSENGTGIINHLNIGSLANAFNRAEFRVVGSGATDIRFEDVTIRLAPPDAGGARQGVLGFVLDDNGVTPIIVEDQFDIQASAVEGAPAGNALLEIALAGAPPQSDIVLVQADRLTPSSGALGYVHFKDMPDGTPIVRTFGIYEYTWNLDYVEAGAAGDGVLESFIRLNFVSRTEIPEPGALMLVGVGVLGLTRRREGPRRDCAATTPEVS